MIDRLAGAPAPVSRGASAVHLAIVIVLGVLVAISACGGGNPNGPSNNNNNNNAACGGNAVGPLGCARGMITGTIDGAPFVGGVPTGLATYTPVAAVPSIGLPAQDFIVIQGTSADLTSLTITARAKVGQAALGVGVIDPETRQPTVHNANLATRTASALAGAWNTNILGGSGTITINSVSAAGASGSFSFTMTPQAGTGATGNKSVNGTFSVTF